MELINNPVTLIVLYITVWVVDNLLIWVVKDSYLTHSSSSSWEKEEWVSALMHVRMIHNWFVYVAVGACICLAVFAFDVRWSLLYGSVFAGAIHLLDRLYRRRW